MKARTKTTRWLLIALLFGLIVAAGLTLTRHPGTATVATANHPAAPKHTAPQQPHPALLAASEEKHILHHPASVGRDREFADGLHSGTLRTRVTNRSAAPSNPTAGIDTGSTHYSTDPALGSSTGMQPQSARPSAPAASELPQGGSGDFAYNGYAPLDCELPAGCGASGGTGYLTHRPSGASGIPPSVHDFPGSTPSTTDSSIPPTNNDSNPPPDNTGQGSNGQGSDPPSPGSDPATVASAPELDPATLGAAVTLLLGSLAVLRSRRARAAR